MQRGLVGGPLDGLSSLPPVRGWVLTGTRGGTASLGAGLDTGEDEPDPLVAWWAAGAGRSVAVTTDAGRVWANDWVNWPEYDRFWEQLARWAMRPGQSREIALRTDRKGERAVVEIEAVDDNPAALLRRFEAVAVGPQGQRIPLKLRQVGPRRWRGEFPLREEGSWFVSAAGRRPGESSVDRVLGAIDMPYPEEFRAAPRQHVRTGTGGSPNFWSSAHRIGIPLHPRWIVPPRSPFAGVGRGVDFGRRCFSV